MLKAYALAQLDRWRESLAAIGEARRSEPQDASLAALEFHLETTANGFTNRSAGMASSLGRLITAHAGSDRAQAEAFLFMAIDVYLDPELLATSYRAALTIASRRAPQQEYFDGFVGGEIYLESLLEGARDLSQALGAIRNREFRTAHEQLWKVAVAVDSAGEGYPLVKRAMYPFLVCASASAEALGGNLKGAATTCSFALSREYGPLYEHVRTLSNLLRALEGSALDRSARGARTRANPSQIYAVPTIVQSQIDTQALTLMGRSW